MNNNYNQNEFDFIRECMDLWTKNTQVRFERVARYYDPGNRAYTVEFIFQGETHEIHSIELSEYEFAQYDDLEMIAKVLDLFSEAYDKEQYKDLDFSNLIIQDSVKNISEDQ